MRTTVLGVMVLACIVAGCSGPEPDGQAPLPADGPGGTPAASQSGDSAADDHAAHGGAGEPAPLLVIMRGLNADMVALTSALMLEDRDRVVSSAAAIANHAPIAPEDIVRIRRELGEEMAEFERIDEEVHDASIRLSEMASSGQMYEVIDQLAEVQRGCIACHTLYRTQLTPSRQ